MGCLTEQLGRNFWRVRKTSSSSDAQPPYLAPLSLTWRQAHIISSTWDERPWRAAASSGDTFPFFVCFSGSWSLSLSSLSCCCHHVPSAVQPGSRCEKAGCRGGRKRRKGEVMWGSGCRVRDGHCTFPRAEGTPRHISSAHLGHSYLLLGVKGRNLKFILLPPSHMFWLPYIHLFSPLAPHSCHLFCMRQGCECFCGGRELAIKKVALSQATCMIYVMADRHLIWFYLLGPFSPWRIESGFKALELFWKVVWNLEQKSWKSSCSCFDDILKQNHS